MEESVKRRVLEFLDSAGSGGDPDSAYAAVMWRHMLARLPDESPSCVEDCDAIPYLPVMPEALGSSLDAGSSILDIGTLGGYGLCDILERRVRAGLALPSCTGTELGEGAVGLARELAGIWSGGYRVDFRAADICALPFDNASFDVAIARLVLPYVRINPALDELGRVLKPGGLAVLQVHSFGYYAFKFKLNARDRHPLVALYYARAWPAGLFYRLFSAQLPAAFSNETALAVTTLESECAGRGMVPVWSGKFTRKPTLVFRKNHDAGAGGAISS